MVEITNAIEDIVYSNPQLLLAFEESEKIGLNYLPYSVGIEIECNKKPNYSLDTFKAIPNIIAVNTDDEEQRYRIPNGLKGLICLKEITDNLLEYCEQSDSGLHYHCDFTDYYNLLDDNIVKDNKNWILEELDTWDYKGSYNSRNILIGSRCWVRFNSGYKTMEVRIGEMSFDYGLLAKRIIHVNQIAVKLKQILVESQHLKGYRKILEKTTKKPHLTTQMPEDNIEEVIKLRKIKI